MESQNLKQKKELEQYFLSRERGKMNNGNDESFNNGDVFGTTQQIQELERFYNEVPHPDENQMWVLAQRINMEANQISTWFQNRRTQATMQQDQLAHVALMQEKEKLVEDGNQLKQAMLLSLCTNCETPTNPTELNLEEHRLKVENDQIKPELENMYCSSALDDLDRATTQLLKLGEANSPFWRINSGSNRESLNHELYNSTFNNGVIPPGYAMEATRARAAVPMSGSALVYTLMETKEWLNVFWPIVSRVSTARAISTRTGSAHLIEAEFQAISPLVPVRRVKFVRSCRMIGNGVWAVVDVTPSKHNPAVLFNGGSVRLPSGLIIEELGNSLSKVTWIEQAIYDESQIHNLYKLPVGSGIGLGARKWLTTLRRHSVCQWIMSRTMSSMDRDIGFPGLTANGINEILKLARRMSNNYYSGINGSSTGKWQRVQVDNEKENMRLMIRKNLSEPGEPSGIVLTATGSIWLPGTDTLVLQEMWNDASGALLVYAPVETIPMEGVTRGANNSDVVEILPSGFLILPDGVQNSTGGGCLLTLGFQMLAHNTPDTEAIQRSIELVQRQMDYTIAKIQSALPGPEA